jgi:hypothetical protein
MWPLVAIAVFAGCYEHTYTVGAGAPNGGLVYHHWRNHWLWGLVSPAQEQAIAEVCPSGNATIHEEVSFLNGLVSALTSGIYSPTSVTVRCDRGGSADLGLSGDEIADIVSDPKFLDWVGAVTPEHLGAARLAQQQLDR